MEPLPKRVHSGLAFLRGQATGRDIEALDQENWRTTWQRTLEQLQAIFSPPKLAYRAEPTMLEDAWFTVLRDEIEAGGVVYAVMLEGTLVGGGEEAFASFLTVAVTLGRELQQAAFPLRASLDWGEYRQSITISQEGRARFPDIPLAAIMDANTSRINRALKLTLETLR